MEDFGAKGNGIVNDSAAIQAVIDIIPATNICPLTDSDSCCITQQSRPDWFFMTTFYHAISRRNFLKLNASFLTWIFSFETKWLTAANISLAAFRATPYGSSAYGQGIYQGHRDKKIIAYKKEN